jgi:hypothetical protein
MMDVIAHYHMFQCLDTFGWLPHFCDPAHLGKTTDNGYRKTQNLCMSSLTIRERETERIDRFTDPA